MVTAAYLDLAAQSEGPMFVIFEGRVAIPNVGSLIPVTCKRVLGANPFWL